MKSLRASLIRLAYANPDLRSHLVPLLRGAASWSEKKDSKGNRWVLNGTGDVLDAAHIQEIEGPGMPLFVLKLLLKDGTILKERKTYKELSDAKKAAQKWLSGDKKGKPPASYIFQNFSRLASAKDFSRSKVVLKGTKIRVRTDEHGRDAIYVEELPQTPLKKRLLSVATVYMYKMSQMPGENFYIPENILRSAKISKGDSYEQAVNKLREATKEAAEGVAEIWSKNEKLKDKDSSHWAPMISEETVNYLTVEPASYEPIEVKGKDFEFTVYWTKFKVYSPSSDFQQSDPHYSGYREASPTGARKLFTMVSANPNLFKGMAYSALGDWFTTSKIPIKHLESQW